MAGFLSTKKYIALEDKDTECGCEVTQSNRKHGLTLNIGARSAISLGLLLTLTTISSWFVFGAVVRGSSRSDHIHPLDTTLNHQSQICTVPAVRREWRTLTSLEKEDYISAVQCLATKPSVLHEVGSLHDDFPKVHKRMASMTHVSAPFLPWHRAYIQVYEDKLRNECGMQGYLPYWDWSQDWESPSSAPVWNSNLGLGGNGNTSQPESVGGGHCVTEGPFADLTVSYFDGEYQPHCLSRGFPSDLELRELGKLVEPSAIDRMMQHKRYEHFEEELERRAHHFLSHTVRGDLSRFTGPNDPVFFLHHANIDRLWWRWQQLDRSNRLYAYDGRQSNMTEASAALTDIMDMSGLGANMPVVHTMETVEGSFCYTY